MKSNLKFTLRLPQDTLEKIEYMSKVNERSKNKEIRVAINRYIRNFENLNGEIKIESKEMENKDKSKES